MRALVALLLAACAHAPPAERAGRDALRGAVVYQVFVRSFSDADGDGVGDLRGLRAKLDVLNDGDPRTTDDLGVSAIWLTPIYPSPSYHGYDVIDPRAIHRELGTLADFDEFIRAAHGRGVRVILDLVLNHASREHPRFLDRRTRDEWFLWRDADPGWTQPWGRDPVWHPLDGRYFYGVFWSGMPDYDLSRPVVLADHQETMRFWVARGVDGFRVDAARHLVEVGDALSDRPESIELVARMRRGLDAVMIAEAWTDAQTVRRYRAAYDHAFAFDLAGAIKTAAKDGLRAELSQALSRGPLDGFDATFLSNHDMPRTMRALGGDEGAARVAAVTLFALPGTPFVYYGEEIGMQGGPSPADEDKRTPMRWTPEGGFSSGTPWRASEEGPGVDVESQRTRPGSLWRLYRDLIALRRSDEAVSIGDVRRVALEGGGPGVIALERRAGTRRTLAVINLSPRAAPGFVLALEGARASRVLLAEGLRVEPTPDGAFEGLAGRGFAFVSLDAQGAR